MKNKLFSSLMIIAMIGMNGALAITQDIGFSVPDLVSVERNSSSVLSSTATVSNNNTLTLDSPITFTYNITNADDAARYAYITATYESGGLTMYSWLKSNNGQIAFSKSDGTGDGELDPSSSYPEYNKNIITFAIICPETGDETEDYTLPLSEEEGQKRYTLSSGESREISCTISGDSIPGTFGMNDEPGEYKATIVVTTIE